MATHPNVVISLAKKRVFAGVIFVALLGILELGARLTIDSAADPTVPALRSGWQTQFFRSIFDWHEPDPQLLWRFRPNLHNQLIMTNSRCLIADETDYEKPPRTARILVLGDSSPVGLGLKDRSGAFPQVLKRQLQRAVPPETRIDVINAAVSGYTSEQIARFLDIEGRRYQPDYVVLYCGNNDASVSGPYSDQDLLESQRLGHVRQLLSHSAVYRLLRSMLVHRKPSSSDDAGKDLVPRVSPRRFGENLRRIAHVCRQVGARLLVVVPPVPYLWPAALQFRPLRHLTGESGELIFPAQMQDLFSRRIMYCIDEGQFTEFHGGIDYFTQLVFRSAPTDSMTAVDAVQWWRAAARQDPDPVVLNNLGVSLWRIRAFEEADSVLELARHTYISSSSLRPGLLREAAGAPILFNRGVNLLAASGFDTVGVVNLISPAGCLLDSALQADWMSLRIKRPYVEALMALGLSDEAVVIDPARSFRAAGGERLFIDHCHPTEKGHWLIADALAAAIMESLPRVAPYTVHP